MEVDLSPESHPLYARSESLFNGCKTLVEEWDELVKYASGVKELPDLKPVWEKDYAEARRVIALGREAAEAEVTRLMTYEESKGKRASKQTERKLKEFEEDGHLQDMLAMGREELDVRAGKKRKHAEKARGWGLVAHRMERGLKELARALPEEDE
jgi:hypothetical protein